MELPLGFRFAGVSAGIKSKPNTRDVTLIVSDQAATAAGVYTQNQVVAAPVVKCRLRTPSDSARALVVNSGNANACTGKQGELNAERMCQLVAEISERGEWSEPFTSAQTLVMSTGIIGRQLPMDKIEHGIQLAADALGSEEANFLDAADGILTTDVARKISSRSMKIGGSEIRIVGMAKGAGMIGPNMATMLCCVLTDVRLTPEEAQSGLQRVANRSFNNISVEGHTSTNDSMVLLANGASDCGDLTPQQRDEFWHRLEEMCIDLAKQIPTDGEGASHLIEITVRGAETEEDARRISHAIASSNLVKTAVYGNDPNWGRIVSAAGYAGPKIDTPHLQLKMNGIPLFDAGEPVAFDAKAASHSIRDNPTTVIELNVGSGNGSCTHWTSDLSVEYVRFNSEYTT